MKLARRNLKLLALCLGTGYFLAARVSSRIVIPDQVGYLVYGASILSEGDLQFYDEFQALDMPQRYVLATQSCYVENLFSPGAALVWLPFQVVSLVTGSARAAPDPSLSAASRIAAGLSTQVLGILALMLIYSVLTDLYSPSTAKLTLLVLVPGSSFLHYWVKDPLMAHVPSLFLGSLIVWVWRRRADSGSWSDYGIMGILLGFGFLIRTQNVLWAALPVWTLVRSDHWKANRLARLKSAAALGAGFGLSGQVQFVFWAILYGSPIAAPAAGNLDWSSLRPLQVLFSAYHGLASWTPILFVSALGLALFCVRQPSVGSPLVLVLGIQFLLVSACRQWWSGASFGSRIFVDYLPVFGIGLGYLIHRDSKRKIMIAAAICSCWTFLLFLGSYTGRLDLGEYLPYRQLFAVQWASLKDIAASLKSLLIMSEESSVRGVSIGLLCGLLGYLGYAKRTSFAHRRFSKSLLPSVTVLLLGIAVGVEVIVLCNPNPLNAQLCSLIKHQQWLPFAQRIQLTSAVGEAEYYLRNGEFDRAIGLLDRAAQLEPMNYEVLALRLTVVMATGNHTEACAVAERAISLYPMDRDLSLKAIQAFRSCDSVDAALAVALGLLATYPDDVVLLVDAAELFFLKQETVSATRLLTRLLNVEATECRSLSRGLALAVQLNEPELIAAFTRKLQVLDC